MTYSGVYWGRQTRICGCVVKCVSTPTGVAAVHGLCLCELQLWELAREIVFCLGRGSYLDGCSWKVGSWIMLRG